MRILHLIDTMNPAAGGTVECLKQLDPALLRLGAESTIATLDDPAAPFLREASERVVPLGPKTFGNAYARRYKPWLEENLPRFDCAIVHGVWLYNGYGLLRAIRRAPIPYFVFTHGMLDPWFNARYPGKRIKKAVYWRLIEHRLFEKAQAILFTCEEERRLARQSFTPYRVRERVVTIGIEAPPYDLAIARAAFFERFPDLAGKRLILFLSRLHEKKGCEYLLEAFAQFVNASPARADYRLVMAGPVGDPAYLRRLKEIERARFGDQASRWVVWPGMLRGELKFGALAAAEAFALPSHQENFGIAVVESLACGTPPLISRSVNIWREIAEAGAGLVFEVGAAGMLAALEQLDKMAPNEGDRLEAAARPCFEKHYEVNAAAACILRVLREELALGCKPQSASISPSHES